MVRILVAAWWTDGRTCPLAGWQCKPVQSPPAHGLNITAPSRSSTSARTPAFVRRCDAALSVGYVKVDGDNEVVGRGRGLGGGAVAPPP